MQTIEG